MPLLASAQVLPPSISATFKQSCIDCHNQETSEGGLDLTALSFELSDRTVRDRWVRIHDRIEKGEMPPNADDLPKDSREALMKSLKSAIYDADLADIHAQGRGPLRRLNRGEYEQNLRDVLKLPQLDIRDMLPEDPEGHRFNKTSESLDMSRVQLAAYLDAAEAALRLAMASGPKPPVTKFRAVATSLFPGRNTFGERKAMFFAKDSKAIDGKSLDELKHDPTIELALFRSAHWPYFGYPQGFIAKLPGEYRVRFSARAVLQSKGYELKSATQSVPMTFRARRPSGADVSGDVRATGGIIDIHRQSQRTKPRSGCANVRPSSTACWGCPCRWLAMSTVARRPIAIHRFPPMASQESRFSGWRSKDRSRPRNGRRRPIACCLMNRVE